MIVSSTIFSGVGKRPRRRLQKPFQLQPVVQVEWGTRHHQLLGKGKAHRNTLSILRTYRRHFQIQAAESRQAQRGLCSRSGEAKEGPECPSRWDSISEPATPPGPPQPVSRRRTHRHRPHHLFCKKHVRLKLDVDVLELVPFQAEPPPLDW
jgi:hypothetical protein